MSHFAVMVVGKDWEKLLAPYQENNMGDCPKEFLEFEDTEDEYKNDWETGSAEKVKMPDGRLLFRSDEEFRIPGEIGTGIGTHKVPSDLPIVDIPFKQLYETFEEFVSDWHGHKERDKEKGRYGYWRNSNAKWDWYQIGGRCSGLLKLKNGNFVNQAKKKDIDIEGMKTNEAIKASNKYQKVASIFPNKEIPKIKTWKYFMSLLDEKKIDIETARKEYNEQEIVKLYGQKIREENFFDNLDNYQITEEEYIQNARNSAIVTFAIIINGKWYEKGEMGWWAIVTDEKDKDKWNEEFTKLFDSIPDDELITIVDCHI